MQRGTKLKRQLIILMRKERTHARLDPFPMRKGVLQLLRDTAPMQKVI